MARIRSIKIGFFTNEDLARLSPWHRLLFAGLWVIADKAGRLEYRPQRIKAQLFPYDSVDIVDLLDGLERSGFIQRYEVKRQGYIAVLAFLEHQHPHHKEPESALPAPTRARRGKNVHASGMHDSSMTPDESADPLVSCSLSLVSGLGNGDGSRNGNGDGEPPRVLATPSIPGQNPHHKPTNLVNGAEQRRHGTHAWCDYARGLCVPYGLHDEFKKRATKTDDELKAWYAATVQSLDGVDVGDDVFDFWRNQFGTWVGTVTRKPAAKRETHVESNLRGLREDLEALDSGTAIARKP